LAQVEIVIVVFLICRVIELGFISEQRRKQIHIFNTYFMAKMRTLFAQVDNDYFQFDSVYEKLERVREISSFCSIFSG